MKNYVDLVNEELHIDDINGLKVYIMPKKNYKKKAAMLTVRYGSNDIRFSIDSGKMKTYPLGIAHFLEHKLFEEKDSNIFEQFAALGSSPNAYTNSNVTSYHFTCTDYFKKNLELLIKFVFNPFFTEDNIKKERSIIAQEIIMYNDSPSFRAYINALEGMYKEHPVRNDVAGTLESINDITSELLYECYDAFYTPDNMKLIVTGDVDVDEVLELCHKLIPKAHNKYQISKHIFKDNSPILNKEISERMGISIPNFVIGYKDTKLELSKAEVLKRRICGEMLIHMLFSKSSGLFNELYSKGLINESFEYEYVHEHNYAFLMCEGESNNPSKVMETISEGMDYVRDNGLDEEDFERSKKVLLGYYISRFNSIDALSSFLNDLAVNEVDISVYYKLLKRINLQDINELFYQVITYNGGLLSIIK